MSTNFTVDPKLGDDLDPELNIDSRDLRKVVEKMVDGIIADPIRAAQLGIVPQGNNTISKRGDFIVNESNIEEAENKKMRGYRHREYGKSGKALYFWHETKGPLELVVFNPAEEKAAAAKGWSATPVHGPSGRLNGEPVLDEPATKTVREFAAPGETQPFDQPQAEKPARRKPGPKPKTKDQVN